MGAVVKIIDFMQTQNTTLAALVDEMTRFYTVRREANADLAIREEWLLFPTE